jgi:phosphoribosyl-ATP pyrophosphohydrolase/phosphoribosyl-AMP cyclohydrolase
MKDIKFDKSGLIPVVIQDEKTKDVLMLAYMNKEALEKTILEGKTHFFSRSRGRLWLKGETSGNFQYVKSILYDCDHDALLIKVEQRGVACHTGKWTCFHNSLYQKEKTKRKEEDIISELFRVVDDRRRNPKQGSYTSSLFKDGKEKILEKILEEVEEVKDESIKENREGIVYEVADLLFHLIVLMNLHGISQEEIYNELRKRRKEGG